MNDADLAQAILSELQNQTACLSEIASSLASIEAKLNDSSSSIEQTLSNIESSISAMDVSISAIEGSTTAIETHTYDIEGEITTGGFPRNEKNIATGGLGWKLSEISHGLDMIKSDLIEISVGLEGVKYAVEDSGSQS